MIVMQYANDGDLLSYLNQNINKNDMEGEIKCLREIAFRLHDIYSSGLVHCDLHSF